MPLELATRLILREAAAGGPLPEETVRAVVAQWAEVPDAASEILDLVAGRGGASVSTREARLADSSRCRWDLVLVRVDDDDHDIEWRVAITAIFDSDRTTFAVRLRRNSVDHRLRPLVGSPAPPAVIRRVLQAEDVDCFDGPLRVEPRYGTLSAGGVVGFVKTILAATDRRLPILAVAKAGGKASDRLDISRLATELAGFAHVILVDRDALPELGRSVESLSLAPSSARLWWPGFELDDDPNVHPHWDGPFDDPGRVREAIRRLVLRVSHDRWREPTRIVEFDRALRRERESIAREAAARVVTELQSLRTAAAADRERVEAFGGEDAKAAEESAAYEARLMMMAGDLEEVRSESERQRQAAEDAESAWIEAEEARQRLEQENRSLAGQLAGAQAQLRERGGDGATISDEDAFARDVESSWKTRLALGDRRDHPLADFTVRAGFVESITRAGADRQKVVDTVMEVACGLAKDMDSRQLHKLRAGISGNAPDRRRDSDGATAWRCNIQRNTPQARRLHYWAVPGGVLEFVVVVLHDDVSIDD